MSNSTVLPPESAIKQLIGLGFLVTAAAREPNLTTLELVPHLLKDPVAANATLKTFFPPQLDPIAILRQLNVVLPQLPRDETWMRITIIYAVMQFIAMVVVALRFYIRLRITPKKLRLEDWVCLATLCVITAWMGSMWAQNRYTGRHVYTLDILDIREHQIYMTVTGIIFTTCHAFVKYTFLVFYYRLYPNKMYHKAVIAVGVFVTIVAVIPIFLLAFGCKPLDWWNHLATAVCIDRLKAFTFQGVCFIIADFVILALPVPIVFSLQLRLKDKILLAAMFGLGGFISIISILRLLALRTWLQDSDFSYAFGEQVMWASAEIVLSLVVACAPALKAGVSHFIIDSDGNSTLPKGFSKWSFTAGGMFKRSIRSGSGSEGISGGSGRSKERNGGGTDWGNGRKGGWGMAGKNKNHDDLGSTLNDLNTNHTTTTCTVGSNNRNVLTSGAASESTKDLFSVEETVEVRQHSSELPRDLEKGKQ